MDAAGTDGPSAEEVFELLGHETRLEILAALWEEQEQGSNAPFPGTPVSFTTLRKRVDMRDGSQFNYHLGRLVGPFVHSTDDGYLLRRAGVQIVSAILSGGLTESVVLDEEPVDDPCPLCGGQVVLEHGTERTLDWLVGRCTACEGGWETDDLPTGTLVLASPLEPAGIRQRSPDELYRALLAQTALEFSLVTEGVCPACSGPIDASPVICEDHSVPPERVCGACGTIFEVRFQCTCDVCGQGWITASDRHFVGHPTVHAFYHDHGYDPFGHERFRIEADTVAEQRVASEDPLEIRTVLEIDGDRLIVALDGAGDVVEVETDDGEDA